jgi:ketosteroid isomerase-like protein
MKALTTLLVLGMFLMPAALADDADDVKAALQRFGTALDTGDANAYIQSHAARRTSFGARGGLLATSDSLEEVRSGFQADYDAGLRYDVQQRHVEVSVYGDTAVTTSYGVGRITRPDGTTGQVNNRITRVWVKQGGQWKQVHQHISPVVLPQ